MKVILLAISGILALWFGRGKLRTYRYMNMEREFIAKWSLLDSEAKQRAVRYFAPQREQIPAEGKKLDAIFYDFLASQWQDRRSFNREFDFEFLRERLNLLFKIARHKPIF